MDTTTRNEYTALLSWVGDCTEGLGELLAGSGSPSRLLRLPLSRLEPLPPRTRRALDRARAGWPRPGPCVSLIPSPASDVDFISMGDERFPAALRAIPDPPPWLFCRGDVTSLQGSAVAVVGSRRASRGGLEVARRLGAMLAAAGYTVCSGLALGIDSAAHGGALEEGRTVAVLASGVDRPSPQRHAALARRVMGQGCLLSELPPGTAPAKHRFPRRNRIISGLCEATIIVEAALPSGSLHTASAALEQGRDVYVVPWSLIHPGGAGCLRLLRDGAVPLTSFDDLSHWFPRIDGPGAGDASASFPEGSAAVLLELLGDAELGLDELQRVSGLAPGVLLALLGQLEVDGWILRDDDRYEKNPAKVSTSARSC